MVWFVEIVVFVVIVEFVNIVISGVTILMIQSK